MRSPCIARVNLVLAVAIFWLDKREIHATQTEQTKKKYFHEKRPRIMSTKERIQQLFENSKNHKKNVENAENSYDALTSLSLAKIRLNFLFVSNRFHQFSLLSSV